MRWFGGAVTTDRAAAPVPVGATVLWSGATSLWLVGGWPVHEVRVSGTGHDRVAVIGPCGISAGALAGLCEGVPDDAVLAWSGAYTVVHAVGDRVTVLTDPAGSSPVYLTPAAGPGLGFVWASSSRALASLAGGGVDLGWLASSLLSPAVTVAGGRSAFAGVGLVRPGHRLRLRAGALPESVPIPWLRPDSAVHTPERLRAVLADAVAVRVGPASTPTADCSGGLDSTTLCLFAAHTKPVTAFTIHPADANTGGDLDYARAATAGKVNIEHVLLPMGTEHDPCCGLDTVPPSDEPAPSTVTYARLAAQLRHLAALGSDAHLTGDGGDTLFVLPPQYLADLLRAGRLTRLARDTLGWARLRKVSPWPILAAALSAAQAPRTVPAWSAYAATATVGLDWATPWRGSWPPTSPARPRGTRRDWTVQAASPSPRHNSSPGPRERTPNSPTRTACRCTTRCSTRRC